MVIIASTQSKGIISVAQKILKRTSRKDLKWLPPYMNTSGMIPSKPGLFSNLVLIRAWSSYCSSIGWSIGLIIGSCSISPTMLKLMSDDWLNNSLKCSTHQFMMLSGAVRSSPFLDLTGWELLDLGPCTAFKVAEKSLQYDSFPESTALLLHLFVGTSYSWTLSCASSKCA